MIVERINKKTTEIFTKNNLIDFSLGRTFYKNANLIRIMGRKPKTGRTVETEQIKFLQEYGLPTD